MQEALVLHAKTLTERYQTLYEQLSETESTPKKEWQETLDTSPFEESAPELFSAVVNRAEETEDPAECLALLEATQDLVSTLKQYLNSMYFAATKRDLPDGSVEDLESLYAQIQDTVKSATNLQKGGMDVDPKVVLAALPTKSRKVKGGTVKTVVDLPRIRVKTRGQRRVGSSNKTTLLVVDGKPIRDTTIGDALRTVGLTWEAFQEMLSTKFPDVKLPWNKEELYTDVIFESHDVRDRWNTLGLRMVK